MNRRTLAEFIVSYAITLDLKLETYLPRVLNMKEIDAYVKKSPGKSASVEELIQFLSHNELQTIIQKISSSVSPDMRSRCELVLKAYVARKVLNPKGLIVEPLQVKNLPGWKRVVGKRK
ncbi:MAG: hypothetical protein FJY86_03980 [Candidatus Diapherotrites archaeon]|uniref:Uncharacterized protein n=1 Tax=Candidatus Iainarchaeum sp. TaxID=3101447 RepID=A0A8T4C7L8_9ARCH|nr:hypothetical protein [Candidatus Diapherotrites archaeon]